CERYCKTSDLFDEVTRAEEDDNSFSSPYEFPAMFALQVACWSNQQKKNTHRSRSVMDKQLEAMKLSNQEEERDRMMLLLDAAWSWQTFPRYEMLRGVNGNKVYYLCIEFWPSEEVKQQVRAERERNAT